MTETMGMKVTIEFAGFCGVKTQVYRNATEVHFNFPSPTGERVAIESDIHGTGSTWPSSWVAQLEVVPEIELAEAF